MAATLVYIYGPPAVGKLTIAEKLAEETGFKLFHNHLTVNAITPVLAFGTPPFSDVLHRLRIDVFRVAVENGISLIFTNNSAWSGPDPRVRFATFAAESKRVVEAAGGRAVFVQLTAPAAVLEARVANDSRRVHGKLLDARVLRERLAGFDQAPLRPSDLTIDTSTTTPSEAVQHIATALDGNAGGGIQ